MATQNESMQQPLETVTPATLLAAGRRWHCAIPLKVAQGFRERFQPTGFPNLGPALYKAMDGGEPTDYLLVESLPSLANWMEALCLDSTKPCRYNSDCTGIPYVVVREQINNTPQDLTSSLTEPHRLASDVILNAKLNSTIFSKILPDLLKINKQRPVRLPGIAKRLFYIDPACLLHGVFLEKLDGRVRFPRLLSATITARHPQPVNAGGVMRGYVTAEGPEASIPYPVQHFTSPEIALDLTFHTDSLKALGLDLAEQNFLATFALYKVERLLQSFPRLRTACVLDPDRVPPFAAAHADSGSGTHNRESSGGANSDGGPGVEADEAGAASPLARALSNEISQAFTTERRTAALGEHNHLPEEVKRGSKAAGLMPCELDFQES